MRTRLIPHAEWFTFFEGFTRRHPGSPATLRLLGPRIGAQVEARDLPLEGIVSDPLATSISIQLGGTPGRNVEHPVAQPIGVWLEMTDEGADAALGINSGDGTTTLLELRSPAPAEFKESRGPGPSRRARTDAPA
jgi:hypothetical protein